MFRIRHGDFRQLVTGMDVRVLTVRFMLTPNLQVRAW